MAGGDVDGRVGPPGAAALRLSPGDGKRLRRRSASTRTPGQPRPGPADGGGGESGGDRLGADTGGGARCSWPVAALRDEGGGARGRLGAALPYRRAACRAWHGSQGVPAPDSGGAEFGADCAWAQMGFAGGLVRATAGWRVRSVRAELGRKDGTRAISPGSNSGLLELGLKEE
jgi:hypothetical protein